MMTLIQNQTYTNETLRVDGNRYVGCTFVRCGLVYQGGELPVFERCTFSGVSLQLAGESLSTLRYLSGMHQGGMKASVEALLGRIEAGTPKKQVESDRLPYDPEYTGTNWGRLGAYSLLLIVITGALLVALHYGLQVFPRTEILEGDTVRPIAAQNEYDLMPALPVELENQYDAVRQNQLEQITTYGWVDEAAGIARIPVDEAMDVLLENGGFPVAGDETDGTN